MGKWTIERIRRTLEGCDLLRGFEVLNVDFENNVAEVEVCGTLGTYDIVTIGEAFGDDDIWVDATRKGVLLLTIVPNSNKDE